MSLRTPMARALGSGSAKSGAAHWISQRASAVALALLGLWFAAALLRLPDFAHATLLAWIGSPVNAVLLVLLIGTAAFHACLGVQVVIEDYVHGSGLKAAALLLAAFAHIAVAAFGIFSVLRIALAGAGPLTS